MKNLLKLILAGLIFGGASFGGLLVAQNFIASVQLSQDPRGPLPVDQAQNVYLTNNRHLNRQTGSSPGLSLGTCSGGALAANSTDFSGAVATATAPCTINFAQTWGTAPACVVSTSVNSQGAWAVATTTTTLAITVAGTAAAATWNWVCTGVN